MKKHLAAILFFILYTGTLSAQGFDWQFSPRMPAPSPVFFMGITGEASYRQHEGSFEFVERSAVCGEFENGTGTGISLGIISEYWTDGFTAFNLSLQYSSVSGDFENLSEAAIDESTTLKTKFLFNSRMDHLTAAFGFKRRIGNSHFHLGARAGISYLLSNTFEFSEKIVSPADEYFELPNGAQVQERDIPLIMIGPLSNFSLIPKISAGYDFNMGSGYYASAAVNASYTLSNVLENEEWKHFGVSLSISIYKGIF